MSFLYVSSCGLTTEEPSIALTKPNFPQLDFNQTLILLCQVWTLKVPYGAVFDTRVY